MKKIAIALFVLLQITITSKLMAQEKCYEISLGKRLLFGLEIKDLTISGSKSSLLKFIRGVDCLEKSISPSCDGCYASEENFLKFYKARETSSTECLPNLHVKLKQPDEYTAMYNYFKKQETKCRLNKNVCADSKGTVSYSLECENIGVIEFTFEGIKKITFSPLEGANISFDID